MEAKWIRMNFPYSIGEDVFSYAWCKSCLYLNERIETNLTKLSYKARGVVIPNSLRIAICFQQRVGCNDLIFQRPLKILIIIKWKLITCISPFCILLTLLKAVHCFTNLHFSRNRFWLLRSRHCDCRKVLDDPFGIYSLSCSRFSTKMKTSSKCTAVYYNNVSYST